MLELLLIALAGLGVLMMFIGRHIMIRDTGGDLPLVWIVVLRLVPFSELVYMVRHYSEAKRGGIISIVGMWLLVPFLGARMWEQQMEVKEALAKFEQKLEQHVGGHAEDWSSGTNTERLAAKGAKVAQIGAKLQDWFARLQQQRNAVGGDPVALKRFNAEAAAYASFNALAKEELAELAALQAQFTPKPKRPASERR